MLELRPICENCARPLPPDSPEARICSFECTFCGEHGAPAPPRRSGQARAAIAEVGDVPPTER